jgi:hypothetical protein
MYAYECQPYLSLKLKFFGAARRRHFYPMKMIFELEVDALEPLTT